jgi:lipoate-protein ligase A
VLGFERARQAKPPAPPSCTNQVGQAVSPAYCLNDSRIPIRSDTLRSECYHRSRVLSPNIAAANLALDELATEQCSQPVVVVGRGGRIEEQVRVEACEADGVNVVRRSSGGGAVVLGPGCLNYSLVFSLERRPRWRNVRQSFCEILSRMTDALNAEICDPSDLAWQGKKVSGNSQWRTASVLLHHGTLLYDFDPQLASRYLLEPRRQPEYRRGRTHAQFLGNLPFSAQDIQDRVVESYALF